MSRAVLQVESRVIVVFSAMSPSNKKQGTTSRLLEATREVLIPESQRYLDIIDSIQDYHLDTVRNSIKHNENILMQVEKQVITECQKLRNFMGAAEIIDEISPRSRDIIVSTGEKLSARIMTAILNSLEMDAEYIALDKSIQGTWNGPIDQSFYDHVVQLLEKRFSLWENGSSRIAVVTGFIGPVPGSILTSIGRGYSDLTAALIAVAVKARELQIWKEVDGIFTADPRKVKKALLLSHISPEETAELTYYGSEVVHPFTMAQVIRASIPIRIKNTFNPSQHGSVIIPAGYITPNSSKDPIIPSIDKRPTAVTIKEDVVVVNVVSNRKSVSHDFFEKIFSILDQHGIIVDLISTSQVQISMALSPVSIPEKFEQAMIDLKKYGTVEVFRDLAILSLVGKEMRNMVGTAAKMFTTLALHNVNIEMISQGASEINISCVVLQSQAELALQVVHDFCILNEIIYSHIARELIKAHTWIRVMDKKKKENLKSRMQCHLRVYTILQECGYQNRDEDTLFPVYLDILDLTNESNASNQEIKTQITLFLTLKQIPLQV